MVYIFVSPSLYALFAHFARLDPKLNRRDCVETKDCSDEATEVWSYIGTPLLLFLTLYGL